MNEKSKEQQAIEVWEKLSPREKLLAVGYSEEVLNDMVAEEDKSIHDEIFEEELSLCAENQA